MLATLAMYIVSHNIITCCTGCYNYVRYVHNVSCDFVCLVCIVYKGKCSPLKFTFKGPG